MVHFRFHKNPVFLPYFYAIPFYRVIRPIILFSFSLWVRIDFVIFFNHRWLLLRVLTFDNKILFSVSYSHIGLDGCVYTVYGAFWSFFSFFSVSLVCVIEVCGIVLFCTPFHLIMQIATETSIYIWKCFWTHCCCLLISIRKVFVTF